MRGLILFVYGLTAYLAGVAALLYFIGFSGNLLVPKSIDSGPTSPLLLALVTDALLIALFGVQHSVMARQSFKRWWARLVPAVVERSTYLLGTCAVLALMFRLWLPIPAPIVWQVNDINVVNLLWGLFALGWVLVLVSSFLINHFELFGLHQIWARLSGRPAPETKFRTPLLYRYVRHPLYAGILLGLWAVPVMTAGHLLFSFGLSTYIFIGIAFEERDLIALFPDRYRNYRDQVGMLFPRVLPHAKGPQDNRWHRG